MYNKVMKKINYAYVVIQVVLFVVSTILFFAEVNVNSLIFSLVSSILAIAFILFTKKNIDDLLYTCLPVLLLGLGSLFLLLTFKTNLIAFLLFGAAGILLLVKTIRRNNRRMWIKIIVALVLYGIAVVASRVFTLEFLALDISIATFALVFALSINEYTNVTTIDKPNLFYLGTASFFLMIYTVLFGISLLAEDSLLLQTIEMFKVMLFIPSITLLSVSHLNYQNKK